MLKILENLHILITKNVDASSFLYTQIKNAGGTPILFPTIKIVPLINQDLLQQEIADLNQTDIVIFISPNAVNYAFPLIQQYWPQIPSQLIIVGPGSGTSEALAKFNFHHCIYPKDEFNSEALLKLPALQSIKNKNIIIFKGEGGREILKQGLEKKGAIVTEINVYKRVCPDISHESFLPTWQKHGLDIIICTSENSLLNLKQMVGDSGLPWLQQQLFLLSSPRLCSIANNLGFNRQHLLAKNATDEALLARLRNWRKEQHGKCSDRK